MQTALKITRSVTIAANRERVWQALTVPEQFSQWFGDLEFAKLEVGQPIHFSWGEKGEIALVEPMDRFGYRWTIEKEAPQISTLVMFTLETVPEGTRLTVTETGFEAFSENLREKNFQNNISGWEQEFGNLVAYLQAGDHA